ncbi:MAG: hypothetical protein R2747_07095 [Pyrinomonadaceae bacterium]
MDENDFFTKSDEWIENARVQDWRSFVAFLKVLSQEEAEAEKLLTEKPDEYKYSSILGWENGGIANYLDAISRCLEDGSRFKQSKQLSWKELAEIFYMGKIYE